MAGMLLPRIPVLAAIVALAAAITGVVWHFSKASSGDLSRFVAPAKAASISAGSVDASSTTDSSASPTGQQATSLSAQKASPRKP